MYSNIVSASSNSYILELPGALGFSKIFQTHYNLSLFMKIRTFSKGLRTEVKDRN